MPRRKLRQSNIKSPFSWRGGREFQPLPTTSGSPSQLSPADGRLPRQAPTPATCLPRSPHKAHGSPAEESHRYLAPGPCAQPRSPSRSRWPPAPQQRWQLQFKCLIKASRRGGGGHAGPAPRPRPGARGATWGAGQRAGGCARARRRRGPGAPACASSSGQTLFSSSVELRLVKPRRPPPPSPGSPAPPIPVRGGRLKGTPRLFLAPAQLLGLPGLPGSAHRTPPVPGTPRRGPASPAPAGGGWAECKRRTRRLEGQPTPRPGEPRIRALRGNPGWARWGGQELVRIPRPRGLAPLPGNSLRPIPAPKFCGRGRALTGP
ncbi:transcription initiation factor TFIID subunit 4-like [Mustela lutreola]|uniref:transcription initiation factor TFIID subunit 4-like n=1 Tax=Mustela lutreola TaxID=9666 RepID=UPI002797ADF6|nr:transcription initiation factor TFIID subunit 4-like [Mustela lutreola]